MRNSKRSIRDIRYRPDGWKNPYVEDLSLKFRHDIFEDGANAMLCMLLLEAYKYGLTNHHCIETL